MRYKGHRSLATFVTALTALLIAPSVVASAPVDRPPGKPPPEEWGTDKINTGAKGVELTPNATPEEFLPPVEAAKARAAIERAKAREKKGSFLRRQIEYSNEGSCWNLVVHNRGPSWFFSNYDVSTRQYWCGYAYVTYRFENRWINTSGAWEFKGWYEWLPGGCVGCWAVNVWNSHGWKLTRPGWPDEHCAPHAFAEGRAGGTYYWERGENC